MNASYEDSLMYDRLAFAASGAGTSYGNGRAKSLLLRATLFSIAAMMAALTALPTKADVIYGTSNGNIVSYNTQTQATTTISTDLNTQSYGIAYSPTNGDLYVVERDLPNNPGSQKIEIFSTSGADLGTFASGMPYNGLSAGLTFDKSGNLYASISNAGSGAIEEFFAGGGSAFLPASLGTLSFPNQMTVDSSNNLFVSDIGNNNVYEYGPARTSPSLFTHQSVGVGGVAADPAGNVYLSTDSNFNILKYGPSGSLLGNPFSNVGSYGLVYSPGTNSIFGAEPPDLNQYNIANGNPATNWSQVSGQFPGTEYVTVQPVPEPASGVLISLAALGLLCVARVKGRVRRA